MEELRAYGPGLGVKLRATVIEAVIWRRYGPHVLGDGASRAMAGLLRSLTE